MQLGKAEQILIVIVAMAMMVFFFTGCDQAEPDEWALFLRRGRCSLIDASVREYRCDGKYPRLCTDATETYFCDGAYYQRTVRTSVRVP